MDYEKIKDELKYLLETVSNPKRKPYATVLKAMARIAVINCELAIEEVERRINNDYFKR